ncbi:MAG: sugar phosphate isomerase/epimerase family protein [Opitutales bacterium]
MSEVRTAHLINAWMSAAKANEGLFRLPDCLLEIAGLGYHGAFADSASLNDFRESDVRRLCEASRLEMATLVIPVTANAWRPNELQYKAGLDLAHALDIKTVCVCGGFMASNRRNAFDADYREFGENLERARSYAEPYGIRLAFHPHIGCLVETLAEFERLLPHCPDLGLHIDVGHLLAVNEDPLAGIERYNERILQIALKEWNVEKRCFEGLGSGHQGVDLPRLAHLIPQLPNFDGWIYVEHDGCAEPAVDSAKRSLEALAGPFSLAAK